MSKTCKTNVANGSGAFMPFARAFYLNEFSGKFNLMPRFLLFPILSCLLVFLLISIACFLTVQVFLNFFGRITPSLAFFPFKRKTVAAGLLVIIIIPSFGQESNMASLPGMASPASRDKMAVICNPAASAWQEKPVYAVFFSNGYFIKELTVSGFSAVIPFKQATIGIGTKVRSFDSYSFVDAAFAVSRPFGKNWSAGLQAQVKRLRIRGYGSGVAAGLNFSLLFKVSEKFQWSVVAINPFAIRTGKGKNAVWPSAIMASVSYRLNEKSEITLDIATDTRYTNQVKAGFRYSAGTSALFRFFLSSGNECLGFGFEFNRKGVCYFLGSSFHSYLGISPQAVLSYEKP